MKAMCNMRCEHKTFWTLSGISYRVKPNQTVKHDFKLPMSYVKHRENNLNQILRRIYEFYLLGKLMILIIDCSSVTNLPTLEPSHILKL